MISSQRSGLGDAWIRLDWIPIGPTIEEIVTIAEQGYESLSRVFGTFVG